MNRADMTDTIKTTLPGGAVIRVEAVNFGGRKKVGALDSIPFDDVTKAVEELAGSLVNSLKKVQPGKTSIEFGIEVGVESGNLTALLCKGTGKANLKIQLEWERDSRE